MKWGSPEEARGKKISVAKNKERVTKIVIKQGGLLGFYGVLNNWGVEESEIVDTAIGRGGETDWKVSGHKIRGRVLIGKPYGMGIRKVG